MKARLPLSFIFVFDSQTYISEIITQHGLCFTFNIAYSHDLLDINATSDDFHFQVFETGSGRPYVPELPRNDSNYPFGLKIMSIIENELVKSSAKTDTYGYQLYFHDPFELPSSFSVKYLAKINQMVDIKIVPQINLIDDSIADYDPAE